MRRWIKILAYLLSPLFQSRSPGVYVLIYHRVSGDLPLELDLPWPVFRKQIEIIAESGLVVSLPEALERLRTGRVDRDHYVLTFDDGYEDFYRRVYPLTRDFGLPATVFVTSGYVEGDVPHVLHYTVEEPPRSMTWEMIGELLEHPLVTVGDHTWQHPILTQLDPERIRQEIEHSLSLFSHRLGFRPIHFAYPRGQWSSAVEVIISEFFQSACIGSGGKNTPETFHPLRIRRIPVRRSDGMFWFRQKLRGKLNGEEWLYDLVRRIVRT